MAAWENLRKEKVEKYKFVKNKVVRRTPLQGEEELGVGLNGEEMEFVKELSEYI